VPVVGEGARALHDHVANLGQALALLATGEGTHGTHVHQAGAARRVDLVADLGAGVSDRVGVGHGRDVGEAAVGSGARTGGDGLLVLEAGVTEVDVHVDKAGDEVLAGTVDDLDTLGGLDELRDLRDDLVLDEDVTDVVQAHLRVDDVGSLDQIRHYSSPPSSRYISAMRVSTPALTWSRILERAQSATSASISMPRFMGPGWQMIALGFMRASRSRDRP